MQENQDENIETLARKYLRKSGSEYPVATFVSRLKVTR